MRKLVPTVIALTLLTLTGCAGPTEDAETTPVGFAAPAATGTPSEAPTEPAEGAPAWTQAEQIWVEMLHDHPDIWGPLNVQSDDEWVEVGNRLCASVNPDGSDLFQVPMYTDLPLEHQPLNGTIAREASIILCPQVHENYLNQPVEDPFS